MRVAVVTDSTADLTAEFVRERGIAVVPLTVEMEGRRFQDRVDLDAEAFLQRLPTLKELPRTAAPAPGAFRDVYRARLDAGAAVLSIHLAKGLSATVSAAEAAAGLMAGPIQVVDGESASLGTGLLVWWASVRAAQGADLEVIGREVQRLKQHLFALTAPITLEYLARGGRIGQAARLLGTLLDMKPILLLEHGQFRPARTVRGERQIIPAMLAAVAERVPQGAPVLAALGHSGRPDAYGALRDGLHDRYRVLGWLEGVIGPAISTHVGPGAFGAIVLPLPSDLEPYWKENRL